MGRAFRLTAVALLAALVVALAVQPACAHPEGEWPTVYVSQSSDRIVEGDSASFYVTMDTWFFDYATCAIDPSTTADPGDYEVSPGITSPYLIAPTDGNTHTFTINTHENSRFEHNNRTINVSIIHYIGGWLGIGSDHTHQYWANFTLVDNTPAVHFEPDQYTVNETDDSVTLALARTGKLTGNLSVIYCTTSGTAASGDYYENSSGIAAWGPGIGGSKAVKVNLKNAYLNSAAPVSFFVNLSDVSGGVVGGNATIVVNRNAPTGTFAIRPFNQTVMEDDSPVVFTIDRYLPPGYAGKASDAAYVTFSTGLGNDGQDYIGVTRTLVFNHGDRSVTVPVTILATNAYDGTRHFTVQLSSPGGGASLDADHDWYDVWILDRSPPPVVSFGVSEESVDEGGGVDIPIVVSGPTNVSGSILFSVESTTGPDDRFTCSPAPGLITFDPGVTTRSVHVSVPYVSGDQETQYVRFALSSPNNLRLADSDKNFLMINNIPPIGPVVPAVQFSDRAPVVDRGTASYSLAIWRASKTYDSNVTLTAGGDAILGVDYTISPAPGSTIQFGPGEDTKTIQISVPSTLQRDRTLTLELGPPLWNASLWPGWSTSAVTLRNLTPVITPTPTPTPIDSLPLALQVSVTPDTLTPGTEAIVSVTVTDGTSPVTGAGVSVTGSQGTLTPLSSQNANGKYFWKLRCDAPGPCTLSITATAAGFRPGTASTTVQVVAALSGALGLGMTVSPDPVLAGSWGQVAVTVTADGQPLPGATVNVLSTGGSLNPPIGVTGPDGVFRSTFEANAVDMYVLAVTASASGHPTASGSYGINVVEAAGRRLYCTIMARPQSVGPGGTADVTVKVTDGSAPVEGADVNLSVKGGSIDPPGGRTGPDGTFGARLVAGDAGTYTLIARATANDSVPATAETLVDVRPGLISAQLVLLALAALVGGGLVLGACVLLVGKLRMINLKVTPRVPYVQADGTSRLPIRVEIYNGFDRPRRVRKNIHVDLETTAGKIDDVIVPAGRSFADAVLTSSRDFGKVTITATMGDRAVASAPVEFRLENGSLAVTVTPSSLMTDSKSSATVTVKVRNGKGQYVSPLEDRAVELKTTLGDIVGSIIPMPARAQSANARILSPGSVGTATITATMGDLKGTGRVEFKALPTRPCAHCGQPVANSATVCPWCGQDPQPVALAIPTDATIRQN